MSILKNLTKHEQAQLRTEKIELIERIILGAFLTWNKNTVQTMVNTTRTEFAIKLMMDLACDSKNKEFIAGGTEKQHKKIGSSNVPELYKQFRVKGKTQLLKELDPIISKMAEELADKLEEWESIT